MRAGRLNHRVVLQRVTEATDATYGEVTEAWATLATVWAEVRPLRGGEATDSLRTSSEQVMVFRIRDDGNVTPQVKDRIVWNGQNWDVSYVAMVGFREGWEITARFNI